MQHTYDAQQQQNLKQENMYITRPLSMYKKNPSMLSLPPPEGPNSGILVTLDEEAEPMCCFGLCKSHELKELPFPQNKNLNTRYSTGAGEHQHVSYNRVVLIPVLDQPLSSNRYYAIQPRGNHKGETFTSSSEEDMTTCCFCKVVSDIKPQPFDPDNFYQQIEICSRRRGSFTAKSVASDGFPPNFLRRKGWQLKIKTPSNFELSEAPGIDTTLRSRLPGFDFPLSNKNSEPVVVGKWYCPFIFVKEGTLKNQVSNSLYYEMTLEQRWEQIFECENGYNEGNSVVVDVVVQREVVSLDGDKNNVADGVMWFRRGEVNVGLSLAIIERMKWEQERFGFVRGDEKEVSVKRVEEFGGVGEWRKFGCYVLVERFVLKRMDGSLVLTYDFKHTHHIWSKWE